MTEELRTDRVAMRHLTGADAPGLLAAIGDYEVLKMTAGWEWPVDEDYVRERIARFGSTPERPQTGFGIIIDNEVAGTVGAHLDLETGKAEIGYMIGQKWWGNGYVSEILPPFCAIAFETLGMEELFAGRYYDNPASGRVLEKAGFECLGPAAPVYSKARKEEVAGFDYRLTRDRLMR